jgi:hypothetical protein
MSNSAFGVIAFHTHHQPTACAEPCATRQPKLCAPRCSGAIFCAITACPRRVSRRHCVHPLWALQRKEAVPILTQPHSFPLKSKFSNILASNLNLCNYIHASFL